VSNHSESAITSRGVSGIVRVTVVAVIVALVLLVAVDNRGDVRLGYVTGSTEAPLWLVVVVAGVAGLVVGWLVKHRPRHR
jgi:uncharacterized integral membrane protein